MIRIVNIYRVTRLFAETRPFEVELGLFRDPEAATKCVVEHHVGGDRPTVNEIPGLEIDGRVFVLGAEIK